MKVTVQFFAAARDLVGSEHIEVEIHDGATAGELRRKLVDACPALTDIAAHLHIAVDDSYASDDTVITKPGRVACFPPVSGG